MIGYFRIFQELRQTFGGWAAALLVDVLNTLTNLFVEMPVESRNGEVFIYIKIQRNWQVGWGFRCQFIQSTLKEGGFTGLARCEDNDVLTDFDAIDEIVNLIGAWDDVVFRWMHGALGAETSHFFLLFSESQNFCSLSNVLYHIVV